MRSPNIKLLDLRKDCVLKWCSVDYSYQAAIAVRKKLYYSNEVFRNIKVDKLVYEGVGHPDAVLLHYCNYEDAFLLYFSLKEYEIEESSYL